MNFRQTCRRPWCRRTSARPAVATARSCCGLAWSCRVRRTGRSNLPRRHTEEHWSTIVCANAEEAARNAVRHRIQLALVDHGIGAGRPATRVLPAGRTTCLRLPDATEPCWRFAADPTTRRPRCGREAWACGCICPGSTVRATSACCTARRGASWRSSKRDAPLLNHRQQRKCTDANGANHSVRRR